MAEYIEKKAIIEFIKNGLNNPDKEEAFGHDAVEILAEIEYMPAADVAEVKRGRWIDYSYKYDKGMDLRCSICGDRASAFVGGTEDWWDIWTPNYCSHCGAKMDNEEEKCNK